MATGTMPERAPTTAPVEDPFSEINIDDLTERIQTALLSLMPHSEETAGRTFPTVFVDFVRAVVGGTLEFFLAFLLSFMIVLDYDRIGRQLAIWGRGPVGRFFHEASASVVDFSAEVGNAFQCQILVALLNAAITCLGMFLLGIKPLLLLTVIVFLFGLIPVLGVFISSVPIVLIAFNTYGLTRALMTIGMIIIVHALEAYLFNPRIYAARFHLNPVIVLIILLVGHELFGVWGMLLGIPVTHYVLHAAQASRGRKPTEPQSLEEAGMPELHTE
jgi:predicted PurR-regulated permease PerM